MFIETIYSDSDFLEHHGVKGMKWGVRRYQNEDGSLTPEGKKQYGEITEKARNTSKLLDDWMLTDAGYKDGSAQEALDKANASLDDFDKAWKSMSSEDRKNALEIVENMIYKDKDFGSMIIYWDEEHNDYYAVAR